jgi:palmitoyltransferase
MSGSSIQLALTNTTTIENLSKRTSVWYLAVHITRPGLLPHQANPNSPPLFRTITFPLPNPRANSRDSQSTPPAPTQKISPRTFAILESRRGDNIFDLGSPLLNLKEVMGHSVPDWFLPFKHSPCTNHSHGESAFKLGPAVQRMKEEAGLVPYVREGSESSSGRRRHRRKRQRHSSVKDVDGKYVEKGRRKHKHRYGSRNGGSAGVLR